MHLRLLKLKLTTIKLNAAHWPQQEDATVYNQVARDVPHELCGPLTHKSSKNKSWSTKPWQNHKCGVPALN